MSATTTASGERPTPAARYSIRYLATRDFGGLCGVMGMGVRVMVSVRGWWLTEPGVRRWWKIGVTATTAVTAATTATTATAAATARLVAQIRCWSWHHAAWSS